MTKSMMRGSFLKSPDRQREYHSLPSRKSS
jgi:hypothetical protein